MRVLMPIGEVRCGKCGYPLSQNKPVNSTDRSVIASCITKECNNHGIAVLLSSKSYDAPEIPNGC